MLDWRGVFAYFFRWKKKVSPTQGMVPKVQKEYVILPQQPHNIHREKEHNIGSHKSTNNIYGMMFM